MTDLLLNNWQIAPKCKRTILRYVIYCRQSKKYNRAGFWRKLCRVISAALIPSRDWRRPDGRPRTTFGSTQLGGRQEIGTFGIKSSAWQRSTEEFATKEEEMKNH